MDIYASEKEQIETVKKLWHDYGKAIVLGVIAALLLSFGWREWQQHKQAYRDQASQQYALLLHAVADDNQAQVTAIGTLLMQKYQPTPYAGMASLFLAQQAVAKHHLQEAQRYLSWAAEKATDVSVRTIAQLRKARVLLAQQQLPQALTTLSAINQPAFFALRDELQGDIYSAQGQFAEAKQAYHAALSLLKPQDKQTTLLEMKLADLATAAAHQSQGTA